MQPNEWQFVDPANGLIYPWYVYPFLEKLATLDLSNATVFEYGLGQSTIWYANKAKAIYGVDEDQNWFNYVINQLAGLNGCRDTPSNLSCFPQDGSSMLKKLYINEIYEAAKKQSSFDIIVVDGLYRDECIIEAINFLKIEGLLIVDNWQQPSVWMPKLQTLKALSHLQSKVYTQTNPFHPDWQTAVFCRTALPDNF